MFRAKSENIVMLYSAHCACIAFYEAVGFFVEINIFYVFCYSVFAGIDFLHLGAYHNSNYEIFKQNAKHMFVKSL